MADLPDGIPLPDWQERPAPEMQARAHEWLELMRRRRSVREFSSRPIPEGVLEDCLRVAGTAVSGANLQPWQFVVVKDPVVRAELREAAEEEERAFYAERAPADWLAALAPLGTDPEKPFLETAPVVIAVFQQRYGELPDGTRVKHYYATESVGIATGFLISALHNAGLVCLTHTPSPMKFLNRILKRPRSERPFLVLVAGYPADDCMVPRIRKKAYEDFVTVV